MIVFVFRKPWKQWNCCFLSISLPFPFAIVDKDLECILRLSTRWSKALVDAAFNVATWFSARQDPHLFRETMTVVNSTTTSGDGCLAGLVRKPHRPAFSRTNLIIPLGCPIQWLCWCCIWFSLPSYRRLAVHLVTSVNRRYLVVSRNCLNQQFVSKSNRIIGSYFSGRISDMFVLRFCSCCFAVKDRRYANGHDLRSSKQC